MTYSIWKSGVESLGGTYSAFNFPFISCPHFLPSWEADVVLDLLPGDSRGKLSGAPQPLNLTQPHQPRFQVPCTDLSFSTMARSLSLTVGWSHEVQNQSSSFLTGEHAGRTSLYSPSSLTLTHSCISLSLDVSYSEPILFNIILCALCLHSHSLSLHPENLFYQLTFLFLFLTFHFSYLPSLFFYIHRFMTLSILLSFYPVHIITLLSLIIHMPFSFLLKRRNLISAHYLCSNHSHP